MQNPVSQIQMLDSVGWRKMGDKVVIVDMERREYATLQGLAAEAWEQLAEGKSLKGLVDFFLEQYAVEETALEKDLLEFVESLANKKLLKI